MRYYEINETAARQARQMWSFYEYKTGSKTAEYRAQVDKAYSLVDRLPDDLKEKGAAIADRYARRLAEWYNKQFAIEMICPSVMICGAGNFPTRKKEKQNAAQDRHYKLYNEIQAIPDKIARLANGSNIIKAGDADAVEQLRAKVERLEAKQAKMKEMNAYFRKHKTMRGYGDLTDEKAAVLDAAIADSWYGAPCAPFELRNNNAKIKAARDRLAQLERLKTPENAPKSAESEYSTELFKVVENTEIMRLQVFFDGKPDADTRAVLKANGFRFAPTQNNAWQRQLTDNARRALQRVIAELEA